MAETVDVARAATPTPRSGSSGRASAPDTTVAEDRRLATLHLRLGDLWLARAELEDLHDRGALDAAELADLAEARWRSGHLDAAAVAAADHLSAGGRRPIAFVIAAEAAAAAGRPGESRVHVDGLGAVDATVLEDLFAGMPRRASWPSALHPKAGPAGPVGSTDDEEPGRAGGSVSRRARPTSETSEPADELARAGAELESGNLNETARGLARLALLLRVDPALAPAVLDLLGPRRGVGAHLLRGDAYRLLGRHLEAEVAYVAAGAALDAPERGRPA